MNAAEPVRATYWLLDAPDSLLQESHRNPDGTGIGWYDSDGAHIDKQPKAAFTDSAFTTEAGTIAARTLVTHIRAATAGHDTWQNTHPFDFDGLIVAHNGGFGDLAAVDAELGPYASRVQGQTDSERYAALIAKFAAERGDVGAGITAAAAWLSRNVPMYSLNCVVISGDDLWALRYPDQRALHIVRRNVSRWNGSSELSGHRLEADTGTDVVLIASEHLDGQDDWRMLDPGELVHVDPSLEVTSSIAVDQPPARMLVLDEPDPNIDDR